MHFLVNIISPFPITDVHQLHIAKINRLMSVSHCKTGIWIRGRNNRLQKRATDKMFQWLYANSLYLRVVTKRTLPGDWKEMALHCLAYSSDFPHEYKLSWLKQRQVLATTDRWLAEHSDNRLANIGPPPPHTFGPCSRGERVMCSHPSKCPWRCVSWAKKKADPVMFKLCRLSLVKEAPSVICLRPIICIHGSKH